MIDLNRLNGHRIMDQKITDYYGGFGSGGEGAFHIPSPVDGKPILVIASTAGGWDHLSISRQNRMPNQRELDHVYRMFFKPGETAMQLFVPKSEHVNIHENCLHLWRPQEEGIPKPPRGFV